MSTFLSTRLAPFKNKNFLIFFFVRTLSLVGRWSHELARSWIILELTGQSSALGVVMLAGAVPVTLLILKGGALVDRSDAKKLMFWTQLAMGALVLSLALFCEWGSIQIWHLAVFAFIEGVIMSYDSPTFQAVVVRLVPKEDFQQAMAINSTNFHFGRMLGPFVAGVVLNFYGPSVVFLFDGLGFIIVAIAVRFLKLYPRPERAHKVDQQSSLSYFWHNKKLRYQIGQLTLAMITIFPVYVTVLKTLVATKFGLTAQEFGNLFMFPALGSMIGSVGFAVWKPKRPVVAVKLGIPLIFFFFQVISFAPTVLFAGITMFCMGFSSYLMFAALTVGLQLDVDEEYRGRVSALVGLAFGSIGPVASFPVGYFADTVGEEITLRVAGLVFFLMSVIWYLFHLSNFKKENRVLSKF